MVFKIENSEIVINGRSVFKALILTYFTVKLCKAVNRVRNTHYIIIDNNTKTTKKEQKISEKKQKVESV